MTPVSFCDFVGEDICTLVKNADPVYNGMGGGEKCKLRFVPGVFCERSSQIYRLHKAFAGMGYELREAHRPARILLH